MFGFFSWSKVWTRGLQIFQHVDKDTSSDLNPFYCRIEDRGIWCAFSAINPHFRDYDPNVHSSDSIDNSLEVVMPSAVVQLCSWAGMTASHAPCVFQPRNLPPGLVHIYWKAYDVTIFQRNATALPSLNFIPDGGDQLLWTKKGRTHVIYQWDAIIILVIPIINIVCPRLFYMNRSLCFQNSVID